MRIDDIGGGPDIEDNTPFFNEAVSRALADRWDKSVEFGVGVYKFATPPAPIVGDGVRIIGQGPFVTKLRVMYSRAPSDNFLELRGRWSHLYGFEIVDTSPDEVRNDGAQIAEVAQQAPRGC